MDLHSAAVSMVIKYRPGTQQIVADALSRLPPSEAQVRARDDLQRRQAEAVKVNERTAGFLTEEAFWKKKLQIDNPKEVAFVPYKPRDVSPLTEKLADEERRRVYINVPRTVPVVDDFDDEVILPDGISPPRRDFPK